MEKATQAQDEKEKYIIEELKNIFLFHPGLA